MYVIHMTTTAKAPMDLTTMTPAEIDALWFPLMQREAVADARADQYTEALRKATLLPYQREQYERWLTEAQAESKAARAEQAPFDAEWDRRGGWVRAFIAITDGHGHVHATSHCGSLHHGRQRTALDLLPQVSGLTTAEVIDLAGERACTRCYPGAPVEKLAQPTRLFAQTEIEAQQARVAKAAAKAEKDAKKAAAAITNPDGTMLIGTASYDEIRTERTAWNRVVEIIFDHYAYGYDEHAEVRDRIIAALVAKTGKVDLAIRAEIRSKLQAKAKRDGVLASKIRF
jgi:hypothetical protein